MKAIMIKEYGDEIKVGGKCVILGEGSLKL